jgi:hypothetical protein
MKKTIHLRIVLALYVVLCAGLFGCTSESEKKTEVSTTVVNDTLPQYNLIILLDLSDRVLFQNQVPRDLGIIKHLYESFKGIAGESSKMFFNSKDKIKVKILEQKDVPYSDKIALWEDTIDINMGQIPFENQSAPKRKKRDEAFYRTINSVYANCIFSKNKGAYLGANIQKYFKQDMLRDLDTRGKNKIFILTDGYPVVEGKSVHVADLENLNRKFSEFKDNTDIYFLEMNPRDDVKDDEYAKLISAWTKWLQQAGFKLEDETYFQKNETNLNSVAERINSYIGLSTVPFGEVNSDKLVTKDNCESRITALINRDQVIDGKNIDDLISAVISNCQVSEVIIDDGHIKRSLKNFLLVNVSSKNKDKYRIAETKLEKGIFLCKTIRI